jgi:tellurite resistance protein TerA
MPIELRKKGEKINLSKSNTSNIGQIRVNLNWNKNKPKKMGLLSKIFTASSSVDLDLGCLYELKNGTKGAVQALGNSFGRLDDQPYIFLDGDDRTGESEDGENLLVNGNFMKEIKRILIYAFIYEGVANWAQADAVLSVKCSLSQDIVIRLDEYDTKSMLCAVAYIQNLDDKNYSIEKLIKFYNGHQAMDKEYKWGMKWVAGSK